MLQEWDKETHRKHETLDIDTVEFRHSDMFQVRRLNNDIATTFDHILTHWCLTPRRNHKDLEEVKDSHLNP